MTYKIKEPVVLDVSHWEGEINWKSVLPTPWMVICKASNGTHYIDPTLASHWPQLKELGIKRGAYHYLVPGYDIGDQAQNYLRALVSIGGLASDDLQPILDVEDSKLTSKEVIQWLDHIERETGRIPMIYSAKHFIEPMFSENFAMDKYDLWLAWYPYLPNDFDTPPASYVPCQWSKWAMWQYAENGVLPGIFGNGVDLNICSEWFVQRIGLKKPIYQYQANVKYLGTVVYPAGIKVRTGPSASAAQIGALPVTTPVMGMDKKVISTTEVWLQIIEPMTGWCVQVYNGREMIAVEEVIPYPTPIPTPVPIPIPIPIPTPVSKGTRITLDIPNDGKPPTIAAYTNLR